MLAVLGKIDNLLLSS